MRLIRQACAIAFLLGPFLAAATAQEKAQEETDFDYDTLATRFRETAFLTPGLRITLTDERGEGRQDSFHYEA